MKKKLALLLMTGALSLTGCSGENNIGDQLVKTYVMKTSGIENDVDYKKYVEYKESGLLSEDGEYNFSLIILDFYLPSICNKKYFHFLLSHIY